MDLDILLCDEMGQVPAEFVSLIDIILLQIRGTRKFLSGLVIIVTINHKRLQPINFVHY